jgi:hypothetical protein
LLPPSDIVREIKYQILQMLDRPNHPNHPNHPNRHPNLPSHHRHRSRQSDSIPLCAEGVAAYAASSTQLPAAGRLVLSTEMAAAKWSMAAGKLSTAMTAAEVSTAMTAGKVSSAMTAAEMSSAMTASKVSTAIAATTVTSSAVTATTAFPPRSCGCQRKSAQRNRNCQNESHLRFHGAPSFGMRARTHASIPETFKSVTSLHAVTFGRGSSLMPWVHCKLQFFAVNRRQQTIIALSRWHTRRRLRKGKF